MTEFFSDGNLFRFIIGALNDEAAERVSIEEGCNLAVATRLEELRRYWEGLPTVWALPVETENGKAVPLILSLGCIAERFPEFLPVLAEAITAEVEYWEIMPPERDGVHNDDLWLEQHGEPMVIIMETLEVPLFNSNGHFTWKVRLDSELAEVRLMAGIALTDQCSLALCEAEIGPDGMVCFEASLRHLGLFSISIPLDMMTFERIIENSI